MGSYILTTVLLFSLLGCGLSSWVRGVSGKRPLDFSGRQREFDYPGKHGFEYQRKPGFDYPGEPRDPTPTEEVDYPDLMREDEPTTLSRENYVFCAACQLVYSDLEFVLKNYTTDEIVVFLDSRCAKLSAPYDTTCKLFMEFLIPKVVQFMNETNPWYYCAGLNLCTSQQETEVESRLGMNPFVRFVKLFREVFGPKLDKVMQDRGSQRVERSRSQGD